MNLSVTANGITHCSGNCLYCSAHHALNYGMGVKPDVDALVRLDKAIYERQYKSDWKKFEETFTHDPQFKKDMTLPIEQRFVAVDVWGADSGTNFLVFQDIYEHLVDIFHRNGYERFRINASTNGLPIMRTELLDWYEKHGCCLQLSHDGYGQWQRTPGFDPMTDIDTMYDAFRRGIVCTINTVTNFWNNRMFQNIDYWNSHFRKIWPAIYSKDTYCSKEEEALFRKLFVKINHIYAGTDPTNAPNKEGHFQNQVYDQLKGVDIGDNNFRNDREMAEKYGIDAFAHVLDDYIQDWWNIYFMLRKSDKDNIYLLPFRSYLSEQLQRGRLLDSNERSIGVCRSYQRYVHKIGDPKYWSETTFVIDTTGRYAECNLIDADHHVVDPGHVQPEYCSNCKFKLAQECNGCGCERWADRCEYLYKWNEFLFTIRKIDNLFLGDKYGRTNTSK